MRDHCRKGYYHYHRTNNAGHHRSIHSVVKTAHIPQTNLEWGRWQYSREEPALAAHHHSSTDETTSIISSSREQQRSTLVGTGNKKKLIKVSSIAGSVTAAGHQGNKLLMNPRNRSLLHLFSQWG